jgi:hypothetical protein
MSIRPAYVIIAVLTVLLATSITIGVSMVRSRDRIIAAKDRSIHYGNDIARVRMEAGRALSVYLEQERRLSLERIAHIEELKAQLNAPRPTRTQPRSKRELRDSFHRALDAR